MTSTLVLPPRQAGKGYPWKLLAFLSVATFFDGYDFIAITQILPSLRAEFGLNQAQGGLLIAAINLGTVAAYLLLRAADRLGRRSTLTLTIAGYTLFTLLSGFAPNVLVFGTMQFMARFFLIAESAVAMVYVVEEFPAERRGMALGIVQGSLSLGMIFCAFVTPWLLKTEPGWRSVYFAGVAPLVMIAFARSSLQESRRFVAVQNATASASLSFFKFWRGPYRNRMLLLGLIWSCTYACTQSAVAFWKEFAVAERSLTDGEVGMAIGIATLVALPLVFAVGRFLDWAGRRVGAAVIFTIEILAVLATFTMHGFLPLTIALVFGIFGASAVQVVLNAFTTELFPTEQRGTAYAWANNLLGRVGYVSSPILVGALAGSMGWGWAVRLTVIGPIIALALILSTLPETKSLELEQTSKLEML